LLSCEKGDTPDDPSYGKIRLVFEHYVDQMPLIIDDEEYVNAFGNHYLITELQYFISDVVLYSSVTGDFMIDAWKDIHYIDNDIPSTMEWNVYDPVPVSDYDSISFRFGISEEKNITLMYNNPPERDMFWPEVLGGGYHYMKLNGKWWDTGMSQNIPYEFHLGIGQIYSGDSAYVPDITGFVHNDFRVNLASSAFTLSDGDTVTINIRMNIENWFQNPNIYNHGDYAENIMQSQEAMNLACENGKEDVFTVSAIEKEKQ
jgi:hypothetical protein